MRTAGIREACQNLSALIDEVRRSGEVVLTEHGRPVARLVPARAQSAKPFRSQARFRATIKVKGRPISETIIAEREDRY